MYNFILNFVLNKFFLKKKVLPVPMRKQKCNCDNFYVNLILSSDLSCTQELSRDFVRELFWKQVLLLR